MIALVAISLLGLVLVQYQLLRTGLLLEKGKFDQNMRGILADVNLAINQSKDIQLMLQRLHQKKEQPLASPEWLVPKSLSDSIRHALDAALLRRGILLKYEFALIEPQSQDTLLLTAAYQKENYRYEEFTRPLVGQLSSSCFCQPILHVHVDHLFNFLLGRLAFLIIPSVLFLLLLVFCLGWLIRTLNRQRQLDQVKNDFINNLTHELKTPVFSISLLIKMLRQRIGAENEKAKSYLELMEQENEQVKGHIERVLELASLESGHYVLDQHPQSVHDIVAEIANRYQLKVEAQGGNMALQLFAQQDKVNVDKMHLENAIQNILENALKYNLGQVQILFSTSNTREGIQLEVKDNGMGIAAEYQQKVFEKFYRVPTGNLHNIKGFGLGLSYVKQIVSAHGGELSLESKVGKGSTFIIWLPLVKTTAKETIT